MPVGSGAERSHPASLNELAKLLALVVGAILARSLRLVVEFVGRELAAPRHVEARLRLLLGEQHLHAFEHRVVQFLAAAETVRMDERAHLDVRSGHDAATAQDIVFQETF